MEKATERKEVFGQISSHVLIPYGPVDGKVKENNVSISQEEKDTNTINKAVEELKKEEMVKNNYSYVENIITLQALSVAKLTAEQIEGMIDRQLLNEIKKNNPHPYFKAYSICHPGTHNPKLLDSGNSKPIHWTEKAVQSLKSILLKGVQFFKGHNKDNSIENRESLGEIVANQEMNIDGQLNHIVIGYFPDKEKVKDFDVCSQEGKWGFFEYAKDLVADTVKQITGIALANSKESQPAFSGAFLLGEMQAFLDGESINNGGEPIKKEVLKMSDVTTQPVLNLNIVKQYIKDNQVHISQLGFTLADVKSDRELGKVFEEKEGFENKVKDLEAEKLKLLDDNKGLITKSEQLTSKQTLEDLMKDGKLNDNQKVFVNNMFNDMPPTDFSQEGLKGFMATQLKLFDITVKNNPVINPTQPNKPINTNTEDMTKKANNPFLKEDLPE